MPGSEQGPAQGGGRNLTLGDHSTRPGAHSGAASFILSTDLGGIERYPRFIGEEIKASQFKIRALVPYVVRSRVGVQTQICLIPMSFTFPDSSYHEYLTF